MLQVKTSSAPLGAEILGVDLSRCLDDAVFQEIVALFHEHEVVYFRNQRLTPEQTVESDYVFNVMFRHPLAPAIA